MDLDFPMNLLVPYTPVLKFSIFYYCSFEFQALKPFILNGDNYNYYAVACPDLVLFRVQIMAGYYYFSLKQESNNHSI